MSRYKLPLCLATSLLLAFTAAPASADVTLQCKACLDSNFYHWGPVAGIVANVSEMEVIVLVDPPTGPSEEIIIPCDQSEIPECDEILINDNISMSGHFGLRVLACDQISYSHNTLVVDTILRCTNGLACEVLLP